MSGRIPRILIDTNLWLWFILGDKRLSDSARARIDNSTKSGNLFLSAASIAESSQMVANGTLILQQQSEKWFEKALNESKTQLLSIDNAIAIEAEQLPKSPSGLKCYEKLIISTARTHNLSLLTQRKCFLHYAQTGFLKVVS